MIKEQYQEIFQVDNIDKPKAKLEDGSIVEFDRCCIAGEKSPEFNPTLVYKFLGLGTLFEVAGKRQWDSGLSQPTYYDFWKLD